MSLIQIKASLFCPRLLFQLQRLTNYFVKVILFLLILVQSMNQVFSIILVNLVNYSIRYLLLYFILTMHLVQLIKQNFNDGFKIVYCQILFFQQILCFSFLNLENFQLMPFSSFKLKNNTKKYSFSFLNYYKEFSIDQRNCFFFDADSD